MEPFNKKSKVVYDQEPPSGESAIIVCSVVVAVYHSVLRTMASEMVHQIYFPLPPTLYRAVPPVSATCTHGIQIRSVVSEMRSRNLLNTRPPNCYMKD